MDGVRTAEGWVRELQGRWPGLYWGRLEVGGRGLQSPHRAHMALCGSCDAWDGERIGAVSKTRPVAVNSGDEFVQDAALVLPARGPVPVLY